MQLNQCPVMMDRRSMAIIRKYNAGGSKNHLSSLQLQDGSAYRQMQMYYGRNDSGNQQTTVDWEEIIVPVVVVFITGIVFLLLWILLCYDRDGVIVIAGDRVGQPPSSPPQLENNDEARERRTADGEVAPAVRRGEPPLLVCTYYRKEDDEFGESSCGVCLAELDDGEALRLLPACMHYIHAACVNEWLRSHDTCPLCRTRLVLPATPPTRQSGLSL